MLKTSSPSTQTDTVKVFAGCRWLFSKSLPCPSECDFLSEIPASVFVMDYDHNAPSAEYLKRTHYNFYKKYRLKNPNTPILFISRPDYDSDKKDGDARLKVIKSTFLRAKKEGDKNVAMLNGKLLFGKFDRENCLVDGTHPNDLGFYRMAKLVYRSLKNIRPDFGKGV